jgi:hypothetical protein
MINLPASSHPRLAGRGIPRIRWRAAGLVVAALAFLAGAPAALAVPLPPTDGGGPAVTPPPPPSITAAAHLPLWAVAAIVAATVVLSVATTLLTLSLERRRQARRTPAAAAESPAGAQTPSTMAEPRAGHADIISSHHNDMYRAGSR